MNAISLTWQPEGAFHHMGFVVGSISNSVQGFADILGAEWDEQVFRDLNQRVRVGCTTFAMWSTILSRLSQMRAPWER